MENEGKVKGKNSAASNTCSDTTTFGAHC
jgi:hypothetical protein